MATTNIVKQEWNAGECRPRHCQQLASHLRLHSIRHDLSLRSGFPVCPELLRRRAVRILRQQRQLPESLLHVYQSHCQFGYPLADTIWR